MESTTRRISDAELKKIKEIQKHLASLNIKMSQSDVTQAMNDFVLDHFTEFIAFLSKKKSDSKNDPLSEWLSSPVSGSEFTNAVEDHDVII